MVFKISTSAQAPKRALKHSKGAQVPVAKFSKILETLFFPISKRFILGKSRYDLPNSLAYKCPASNDFEFFM